jgi:ABC-type glycerol-3-phosphate transport system substrate-binding protein
LKNCQIQGHRFLPEEKGLNMVEIEFTVMEGVEGDVNHLLPLLDAFEKQYNIHVNLTGINWVDGWAEIARFGIYGHGPDVSSIGTTWIGSLAAMQALRPFTPQQVRALGGADAFFESNWRAGLLPNDSTPWAIPWLGDALVIYYWKDALEKIGIRDFKAAFARDASLVDTLEKLQRGGCAYPLAINTTNVSVILQEAAHWVWSAGGDFISPDNQRVIFNKPAAMQGFKNYFSLRRFISPEARTTTFVGDSFNAGKAMVHLAGPWLGTIGRLRFPEWGERLGVAQVPGITFAGGCSFVIWQYSPHHQEAFELVRFLSSQPTRIPASPHSHEAPTRRDAINMPSVEYDPFHRIYLQALQTGRSFPTIRLWGSVEEKLITEISNIWTELFANPDQDLDACLHKHLDPLAERLNIILGS